MRILKPIMIILCSLVFLFVLLTFWNQCLVTFFAAEGDVRAMAWLLKRETNLNAQCKGNYPLIAAAEGGQTEMVVFLLKNGAKPDVRDDESKTPLIWAAEQVHPEVVAKLIEAGADVNLQDGIGASALWYAVRSNSHQIVAVLLRAGADSRPGPEGITPIALATRHHDSRMIEVLTNGKAQ